MVVGLTGGIGSGKTFVTSIFKKKGVPIYISDIEAKRIMVSNEVVIAKIKALFGEEAYLKGELNRKYIADQVFSDKEKLSKLNAIVHPEVAKDFKNWYQKQNFNFVIKESAILFESGSNKNCDAVILVTAPEKLRIQRVVLRDQTTEDQVKNRMKNQWADNDKRALSDFIIENITKENTESQVEEILNKLIIWSFSC